MKRAANLPPACLIDKKEMPCPGNPEQGGMTEARRTYFARELTASITAVVVTPDSVREEDGSFRYTGF